MRLSSIMIKNFQGLQKISLALPGRTTLLLGRNGSGKSTILRAVQHVLTGQTFDNQARRMKAGELIGAGARQAEISLTMTGQRDYVFTAVIKDTGTTLSVTDGDKTFRGRPDEVRSAVWDSMGVSGALMPVVCHPRTFICSSELSKLLAELGGGIDMDALLEWAGEHGQWLARFLAEANLTVKQPADLTAVGKAVEIVRRDYNRDLRRLNERIETASATAPIGKDGQPITAKGKESIVRQLGELRQKRDSLLREIGASEGRRPQSAIAADVEQVQAALKALKAPKRTDAAEKLLKIETEYSECAYQENQLRVDKEVWESLIESAFAKCPKCHRHFTPADKDNMNAQAKILKEEHEKIKEKCERLRASMEPLRKQANAEKAALTHYEDEKAALERKLAALRAEQPAQDIAALQAEVDSLAQRIERGETILRQIEEYAVYEAAVQERDYLTAEIEHLNWAVEAFRDGAAAAALCRDGEQEFLTRLQSVVPGAVVAFEDGDTVLQIPRHGRNVQARYCSMGELCQMQIALVRAFDCGFGIIDGLDSLDGTVKSDMLRKMVQSETGFLLAAAWGLPKEPTAETVKALSPATVVWVDGENTRVLG